jgi:hypothetical protein
MQKHAFSFICSCSLLVSQAQITVLDSISKYPVSYATISFGNGQGVFADDEGVFVFNKKRYPDIDSLFISALGYKDLKLSSTILTPKLLLQPQADELDEVLISFTQDKTKDKKYKTQSLKPYLDDYYYNCWLPTIASEITVFFPNENDKLKRIAAVKFPVALESKDWDKRNRSNTDKKAFSTLFKVNFYANDNGKPGKVLTYKTIIFKATEKDGDYYDLDISSYNIFTPQEGAFVSLQVLGCTNKTGKLLPNKKDKEIEGRNGTIKIPTNFRPLLPFTDEITENRTFIKRIFISGNAWQEFKKENDLESTLLKKGLNNYGIGMDFHIFKDE